MSDAAAARTPSGDNNNNNNNNNSATTSTNDDWRSSVLHSYRNNEVREIAKILASIEGESTTVASKMMLSMKFEDQIFKSASSFDDYKKKIAKRLKKVQKTYAQQKAASGGDKDSSSGAAAALAKSTGDSTSVDEPQRQELLLKLRQTYGDMILYVIKNASLAMSDIERKLGPEKVEQFKPHITSCQEWAQELGIWNGNDDDDDDDKKDDDKKDDDKKDEPTKVDNKKDDDNDDNDDNDKPDKPKPSTSKPSDKKKKEEKKEFKLPALSQLQRLEQHLEKRAKNIRDYVVKHADPELFLMETLERKDADVSANRRASKLLAVNLSKRIQFIQQQHQQSDSSSLHNQPQQSHMSDQANTNTATPLQALQQALNKAKAAVPPPTRTDSKQLEASLRHLEKMRNASTALMNYWTIGEDRIATAPPQTLKRIYDVMAESMEFISNTMKEKRGEQGGSGAETVTLQYAWSKRLELPPPIVLSEDTTDTTTTTTSPPKRPRTNEYKPYIKARLLLNPNRKTPSNLLSAIRHKGARLVRPNSARGNVNTTHLILEFGTAFTMTIYLSPLTVNIRAMTSSNGSTTIVPSSDAPNPAAPWQPLSYGLTSSTGTASSSSTSPRILSVWGVSSTYDSIGHVVEERLRDASTRATYLLRKCFQNHVKDKTVDFEVEILEGSALLEFLNIARETYMPGWQDYDY